MFRRVYSAGFTQRPDLTVMGAFSGLEMACWDIVGKDRDRPAHALMGGVVNDRIRAYTYLYPQDRHPLPDFWTSPEMAVEVALALIDKGYTALKFDTAGPYTVRGGHMPSLHDIETTVRFCETLRSAIGPRADLLFGSHGQFTPAGAIRLGNAIAHTDPLWFEEPVPPDNPDGMALVAAGQPIPIATGERLTTLVEFLAALRNGVAIVQPALGRSGGLRQGQKIATLAEAYGAQVAPHLYAGPVEWAANVQLAATLPNILMCETIETDFHHRLIGGTLTVENGMIPVPTGPGLGIVFDEDLARAHPYTGDGLHLQMQEDAISYHGPNAFEGGAPVKRDQG